MYIRELRVRYRFRRLHGSLASAEPLRSPAASARLLNRILGHEVVEVCGLLCLSTRHDLLAYHELSRGTLDSALIRPREVLRIALLGHASAVIVGHNHPSGDPTPSPDDIAVTQRLVRAGDLVGINVIDHVIVTGDGYVSLGQSGLL